MRQLGGPHVALFYSHDEPANSKDARPDSRLLWFTGMASLRAVESLSNGNSTANYWPLTDQQGTVRDLYQGSTHNSITDHINFDAFGKPAATSSLVQFLYVGQQYDNETGLQYSRGLHERDNRGLT